jgi:hypothetical protein
MGFGLVMGFIEHLQIVTASITIALLLIYTFYNSLQQALSLLNLLHLQRLWSLSGFQRRSSFSFHVHVITGWRLSHNKLNS